MAGHIQDRWYKTETGSDGRLVKAKTERYGTGMRYRARYVGPDGTEKSKSFPDRQKRLAEQWLANVEVDIARGQYIDPRAGRLTLRQYAERWWDRSRWTLGPSSVPKCESGSMCCRIWVVAPWDRSGRRTSVSGCGLSKTGEWRPPISGSSLRTSEPC